MKTHSRFRMFALAICSTLILGAGIAYAADYPSRSVEIVVPYPPGGVVDLIGRAFATELNKVMKVPVPVMNKPGAAGAIGAKSVASARPDGHTILVNLGSMPTIPEVDTLFGRPRVYDMKDFYPLARLTSEPMFLIVGKNTPWKTLGEFVTDAKANPGKYKYASSGLYTPLHLCAELFTDTIDTKFIHMPAGGGAPAMNALLGGHVDFLIAANWAYPHMISGEARPLAATSLQRSTVFPDVPTMHELGYNIEFYQWVGVFINSKTPPDIVEKLRGAVTTVAQSKAFQDVLVNIGSPLEFLDSDSFAKFMQEDFARNMMVVNKVGRIE
jgi:tripartite-type tricarboxylate transporter receptor subunit TctC